MDRLIADLDSSDSVRRDASIARLRVLGARAVPRLAKVIASSSPSGVRVRAMAALEGIDDRQASEIALHTLTATDVDLVVAALGVLRGWVPRETGTRLLEAITVIAVDRNRDARLRVAAVEALSELPDHLVRPIREQAPPPEAAGPLLDDPVVAREWVDAHGAKATLATLHDAIKTFRDSEDRADTSRGRAEWITARGAAHERLAERGSRLALYRCPRDPQQHARSAAIGLPGSRRTRRRRQLPGAARSRMVVNTGRRLAHPARADGATDRRALQTRWT